MKTADPAVDPAASGASAVCFGNRFVLDPRERRLTHNGQPVSVQPKTLDLLICLVENAGNLVHRDQLMARLWPGVVVTDASLSRCVKQARQALGDDANQPRYIETVTKAGYRFVAPVSRPETEGHPESHHLARGRPWILAIWIAVLAVAGTWLINLQDADEPTETPSPGLDTQPLDVRAINAERAFRSGKQALALRSGDSMREARAHFEKALEEDPRHAGSMAGLAMTMILTSYWPPDPEIRRRAMALAEQALSIDPQEDLGYVAKAMTTAFQPGEDHHAERAYRRALELNPESEEAIRGLATLLTNQGRINESIELMRQGLALNPWHTTLTGNLAISLAKKARYEEAMDLLASLKEVPDARPALIYPTVSVLTIRGRHAEAMEELLEGLEASPSMWGPMTMSRRLADIGENELARALLESTHNTCESDETRFVRQASVRQTLGPEHWSTEPFESASEESYGNRDQVLRWVGRLAMLRGDAATTIKALQALYPETQEIRGWQGSLSGPANDAQALAWALIQVGQKDQAEIWLDATQQQIQQRWTTGYRSYFVYTLLEARNAALRGDAPRAIGLMERAMDEGWLSLWQLESDPRWRAVSDTPGFRRLSQKMATRAAAVRAAVDSFDLEDRLMALMERHGGRSPPLDCPPGR